MGEIVVSKPTQEQIAEVTQWPIWTCDASTFDWHYDEQETCYLLAGEVTVVAGDERATFGAGDMVVFPQGMDCTWQVAAPVRKHYKFG